MLDEAALSRSLFERSAGFDRSEPHVWEICYGVDLTAGGRVRPEVLASSRSALSSFTTSGRSKYRFFVSPGNAVVVDVGVQPVGSRAAGGAEEVVESVIERPTFDLSREIRLPNGINAALIDRLPVFVEEGKPKVPLAYSGGLVAGVV